jgi:hypothetical protein
MIRRCSARKVFDVNVVGKEHQYAVHRGQRDAGPQRVFPDAGLQPVVLGCGRLESAVVRKTFGAEQDVVIRTHGQVSAGRLARQ